MADVVVVGSLHLDVVVRAGRFPQPGETLVGDDWAFKCGGKGGNQAVAAAMHGATTAMIGCVGNDDFGERLRHNLSAAHVDHSAVQVRTDASSGMSVALERSDGENAAVIVSGANLALGMAEIEGAAPMIRAARILLLQNEIPEDANRIAAGIARGHGMVILNAAPARGNDLGLLACVDLLVVNALEAEAMTAIPVTDLRAAERAADALLNHVEQAIVTVGSAGLAWACRHGATAAINAIPVRAKSTHGAGDMFVGALGARLSQGMSLGDALNEANKAAACHVAGSPTS
jgi:ribokinase